MKISAFTILFIVSIYLNEINGKSLKSHYANPGNHVKGQRKPLASPVGNSINDDYNRSKRHVPQAIHELQDLLNNAKMECVREMNMHPQIFQKPLMYEKYPTNEEKCLMMCMLKKTKLMDNGNQLVINTIAQIASTISDNNPLVVSIAVATANNCNGLIRAEEPCEAANQISRCISNALKAHKLKLHY